MENQESTAPKIDTREIELTNGYKVEIRVSLPAREYVKLKNYITSKADMETKIDGYDKKGAPRTAMVPSISGEAVVGLEEETMRAYVITFDGTENSAYDRMMDAISGSEYEKVKDAVDAALYLRTRRPQEESSWAFDSSSSVPVNAGTATYPTPVEPRRYSAREAVGGAAI